MFIQTSSKNIYQILTGSYYKIPEYQRPFSWEKEHIGTFLNDVMEERDGNTEYFIGSMVIYRDDSDGTYAVVDGQQRLTTITIVLAGLRDCLRDEGFKDPADGAQLYIERKDPNTNKLRFVLIRAQDQGHNSYLKLIQKSKNTISSNIDGEDKTHLEAAYQQIVDYIQKLVRPIKTDKTIPSEERKEIIKQKLLEVREKILKLQVILIELDNEVNAFTVFETLNARGDDLEVSDLIKNYLFSKLPDDNKDAKLAKYAWDDIAKNVRTIRENFKIKDFIYDHWLSQQKYISTIKLYKIVKTTIANSDLAEKYLNDLCEASKVYTYMLNPSSKKKWTKELDNVKSSLKSLQLFRIEQASPLLLAVMRAYEAKELKKKALEDILRTLENFHFIFTAIVKERANKVPRSIYAKAARNFYEASADQKVKVLSEFRQEIKEKLPVFEEFQREFEKLSFTENDDKQKSLVKYILTEIEKYHRSLDKSGVSIAYDSMSIEHLASQNPYKGQTVRNCGKIGNLVLAEGRFNSDDLSNKIFDDKKDILLRSDVWVDESIRNANEWGESEIEQRTKALASIAYYEVWGM